MSEITTKKSNVKLGKIVEIEGMNYRIIESCGEEMTFVEEESPTAENLDRDSNPIVYGKRRYLVELVPRNNFEFMPKNKFDSPPRTHKIIKYKIGNQYKRTPHGKSPTQSVSLTIKEDYTDFMDKSNLIDNFLPGSPMSPNNEKENLKLNSLLKRGVPYENALNKLCKGDIQELDIVVLLEEIDSIPIGTIGTVVHIHSEGEAYEIEFFDGEKSYDTIYTVFNHMIEKK